MGRGSSPAAWYIKACSVNDSSWIVRPARPVRLGVRRHWTNYQPIRLFLTRDAKLFLQTEWSKSVLVVSSRLLYSIRSCWWPFFLTKKKNDKDTQRHVADIDRLEEASIYWTSFQSILACCSSLEILWELHVVTFAQILLLSSYVCLRLRLAIFSDCHRLSVGRCSYLESGEVDCIIWSDITPVAAIPTLADASFCACLTGINRAIELFLDAEPAAASYVNTKRIKVQLRSTADYLDISYAISSSLVSVKLK